MISEILSCWELLKSSCIFSSFHPYLCTYILHTYNFVLLAYYLILFAKSLKKRINQTFSLKNWPQTLCSIKKTCCHYLEKRGKLIRIVNMVCIIRNCLSIFCIWNTLSKVILIFGNLSKEQDRSNQRYYTSIHISFRTFVINTQIISRYFTSTL